MTGLIEEHAVITQPGYFFDMGRGAYLVLSLITPARNFDEGVDRLCSYVFKHS